MRKRTGFPGFRGLTISGFLPPLWLSRRLASRASLCSSSSPLPLRLIAYIAMVSTMCPATVPAVVASGSAFSSRQRTQSHRIAASAQGSRRDVSGLGSALPAGVSLAAVCSYSAVRCHGRVRSINTCGDAF